MSISQKLYKYRSSKVLPTFIEVRSAGENVFKREGLDGFVDFSNNTVDALTSTVSMYSPIENKDHAVGR